MFTLSKARILRGVLTLIVAQAFPVVVAWPVKRIATWYFFAWVLGRLRQSIRYVPVPAQTVHRHECKLLLLNLVISLG